MKKFIVVVLLSVICISLSDEVHGRNKISKQSNIHEVDLKLKLLNKPAVKSIKSLDGDIIDCVDIYKQPAFDHPKLRNHTIQLKPSFLVASEETSSSRKLGVSQTWQKSGTCPEGTIPIRRVKRRDVSRANSLQSFGRKGPQRLLFAKNDTKKTDAIEYVNSTRINLASQDNRAMAYLLASGYNYIGAQGDINVWNPRCEQEDYTTGQIWLKHGPGDAFESVEAGWIVNPKLYGDTRTRLFVHWTLDAYKSTGCFDLICQGFVQTNPSIALGASLEPWSSESGPQYQFTVSINLDPASRNWWVKLTNNVVLGYFPSTLFEYLKYSAIVVEWGGEVYGPNVRTPPHTTTAMGSGEAAATLEGSASYIKGVRIIDYSTSLKYPQRVDYFAHQPYCYSSFNYIKGYTTEPVFFFGGRGRSQLCP